LSQKLLAREEQASTMSTFQSATTNVSMPSGFGVITHVSKGSTENMTNIAGGLLMMN
jgi:hypothetical protein